MAGDWIKMRGNLWDDPRVASLVDATDTGEAQVVGGLYWLWATADQHTEDGAMPGLTLRQIDRKTGIPGFGAALASIGWIAETADGIELSNFTEHNGSSAKRRASDAQRKANFRSVSASDADKSRTTDGQYTPDCGAREREEKRREEDNTTNVVCAVAVASPTPARKRSAPATQKPEDVDQQTWDDWVSLRTKKRASVSLTVVDEARAESVKAGITLDRFLRIWCLRGSQGLQADWLKPAELQRYGRDAGVETFAQQAARERMEEVAPMVARQAPGRSAFDAAQRFMDGDVIDVTPSGQLSLGGGRHG